jgi:TPR repeat protein
MYDNGDCVEIDKGKAIFWFERAAMQGVSRAQYYVGVMYDDGEGVEIDKEKAFKWYHKAAIQGDSVAQFNVGLSAWRALLPR